MSKPSNFVSSAPAPSAAAAARAQAAVDNNNNNAASSQNKRSNSAFATVRATSSQQQQHRDPSSMGRDDTGQLIHMTSGPRLNPHAALKEFNSYLLQVLDGNDEEKRQIISRLRLIVQAQRSAAAVREDMHKMIMEFNETQRTAEELRLALQESRESQRRLENENRVLAAQVEDDRAKIAALVKLCRAEIAAGGTSQKGEDILLSIQSHGKANARHNIAQQQQQNKSAAANNNTNNTINYGAGLASAARTPLSNNTNLVSKQASLRAACSTHGAEPAFNCPAGDVDDGTNISQNYNNNNQMIPSPQDQNMNNNNVAPTDLVAQVLAGTAPGLSAGSQNLVVSLRMESDALKQLIDEQRAAYEASRAAHVRVARDCDRRHYEEAQRMALELQRLSDLIVTSTKDLCETRQNANVMQRQLRGEIEGLVQRSAEAEKSKNVQSARQTEELRVLSVCERSKNAGVTDRLRTKVSHYENKIHTIKENSGKEAEGLKEALAMAQETASRERRLRLRAEEHAKLKAQGQESDLGLLRAQLRALEKKAFFSHVRDIAERGSTVPLENSPTEQVEVDAPEDDNEAIGLNYDSNGIAHAAATVRQHDMDFGGGVVAGFEGTNITTAPAPTNIFSMGAAAATSTPGIRGGEQQLPSALLSS